jgi:hypothetical protein
MKISEIDVTACSSWCPIPEFSNFIVTGTIPGTLDFSSSDSNLEIWKTNIDQKNAQLLKSLTVTERFNKLSWGNINQEKFKYGIIAGSMIDGSIGIWDANLILE